MRIIWKTDPRGDYYEVDVPDGMTLEGQYRRKSKHFAYVPLMAKVNGIYRDLCTVPENGDIVEMLDMRSQPACYVYQNSLTLMFIAAVKQVMPYANVHVDNSLNQGLYINLIDDDGDQIQPDEAVITEIDTVMREMVENDEPIERDKYPKDEAIRIMREDEKLPVMATVLEKAPPNETIKLYKLRGMTHCAYTQIVPSCGYLQIFQLMPYKDAIILRYPNTRHPGELPPYIDQYKLYDAFKFQKSWDELTGINYSIDMKRYTKDKAYKKLILLSEALHEKRIAEIADRIKREKKRIILIAGPSSSGKTTFAKRLLIQLMVNGFDPLYMGTDDYFVERDQTPLDEHGEPNYEGFNALDVELFNSNMNDLLAGKEVDLPTFNFLTGKKEYGKRITSVGENQPIIIEGIHALNAALTEK
ncbi:MAG: nucleoside kinase, partial [Eubacterium sp.]|nr:nucleoside kinase [Eubacterium sp.]